jgi:hypothetical protein
MYSVIQYTYRKTRPIQKFSKKPDDLKNPNRSEKPRLEKNSRKNRLYNVRHVKNPDHYWWKKSTNKNPIVRI